MFCVLFVCLFVCLFLVLVLVFSFGSAAYDNKCHAGGKRQFGELVDSFHLPTLVNPTPTALDEGCYDSSCRDGNQQNNNITIKGYCSLPHFIYRFFYVCLCFLCVCFPVCFCTRSFYEQFNSIPPGI